MPKTELDSPSATLWLLNCNVVRKDDIRFFVERLSAGEARRYARFARKERQRQFLLGRMLVRFAVAHLTGLPPEPITVIERPGNAPQLVVSDSQLAAPHFSISHSRRWVACVVSTDAKLGMDIEVVDPRRDTRALSAFAFEPDEQRWLLRWPEGERALAFYQLWSTREALYKLMPGLGGKTILPRLIRADDTIASRGYGWYRYASPHPKLAIAICSDRLLSAVRKIELTNFTPALWSNAETGKVGLAVIGNNIQNKTATA